MWQGALLAPRGGVVPRRERIGDQARPPDTMAFQTSDEQDPRPWPACARPHSIE
jgi:hypothetical protein